MYLELHDNIIEELEEDQLEYTFFDNDEDLGSTYTYDTNIKGSFTCGCKRLCLSGCASIPQRFTSDRLPNVAGGLPPTGAAPLLPNQGRIL
ncbi:hypothetical protein FOVSG1_009997 [Fusarium oxysporum f. sp. vasinfectum]